MFQKRNGDDKVRQEIKSRGKRTEKTLQRRDRDELLKGRQEVGSEEDREKNIQANNHHNHNDAK